MRISFSIETRSSSETEQTEIRQSYVYVQSQINRVQRKCLTNLPRLIFEVAFPKA